LELFGLWLLGDEPGPAFVEVLVVVAGMDAAVEALEPLPPPQAARVSPAASIAAV